MIEELEQSSICFYQQRMEEGYRLFQKNLPALLDLIEKRKIPDGILMIRRLLDEVEKKDWVMVADYIHFELIPMIQNS